MRKLAYYLWLGVFIWAFAGLSKAHSGMDSRLIVKRKNAGLFVLKEAFRVKDKEVHKFKNKFTLKLAKSNFENDPDVEWVVEDKLMKHHFEPGDGGTEQDQLWFLQWHYHNLDSGINLPQAWDSALGEEVTVAVVDTGITSHIDLNSKVLPGADLVTDPTMGNDGGGRDNDPSDPGDWIASGDPCYMGQDVDSSWHGTHVAGTVAASTGNGHGVAGVSWNAKVVPVRVLGKCGGWASDIADGIKWAAGVPVSGVSNNSNPARVINLSLGGRGPCSAMMQEAVDVANAAGAVVVVAAGNSNHNIDFVHYSPANCKGVITVSSTDENMDKSFFSNYGEFVDVAAPGGGDVGVMSTHNNGTRSPGGEDYIQMKGTSMAAPHVAGVAALMLGTNPDLSPAQVRQLIIDSAREFTNESNCTDSICGAGLLDAEGAVLMAISTPGDPDFVFNEPLLGSSSEPVTITWFNQFDEEGGGCGTVDMNSGGPGGPFNMSLLLGFFMALVFSNFRIYKTR